MVCTSSNTVTTTKKPGKTVKPVTPIHKSRFIAVARGLLINGGVAKNSRKIHLTGFVVSAPNGQKTPETTLKTAIAILKNPQRYAEALAPPYKTNRAHPGRSVIG